MFSIIHLFLWILSLIYPVSQVTSLKSSRLGQGSPLSIVDDDATRNDRAKLIVTTILEPPFMMLKKDGVFLTGNDRFEGFMADVLKSLSRSVGFMYELRLVGDLKYGSEGENGTWTGMIGEIYKGHADLAVGPIVMTDERSKVVEFTDPVLTFQSCALVRKPGHSHHKRRKARSRSRIHTLQDLYQSNYKYGVVEGSITQDIFRNSADDTLQQMWSQMVNSWPSAFVHSVQAGVQRVEREKYAFILDTPKADYIASRKPCNYYSTDEFLDEQHYAFALRHSRSLRLRRSLNENIRNMKTSGELAQLYEKWWKSECDKKRDTGVNVVSPTSLSPWRFVTVTNVYALKRNGAEQSVYYCNSLLIYLTVFICYNLFL